MDDEHRARTRRANRAGAVAGIVISSLILTSAKLTAMDKVDRAHRDANALAAVEWIIAGARREPAIGAYRAHKKLEEHLGIPSGQVMENLARIYEARADTGPEGRGEGWDTEQTRIERDAREQVHRTMHGTSRTLAIAHEHGYERGSVVSAPLGVLEMRDLGRVAHGMTILALLVVLGAALGAVVVMFTVMVLWLRSRAEWSGWGQHWGARS